MRRLLSVLGMVLATANATMLVRVTGPDSLALARLAARADLDVTVVKPGSRLELFATPAQVDGLRQQGTVVTVLVPDFERWFATSSLAVGLGPYYSYDEMKAELDRLAATYPALVRVDSLGTTWEGRTVWGMELTAQPAPATRPRVLYTGVHHAREPIGCTVSLELARLLCARYATDPALRYLVDHRVFLFVPVVNPDGYVFNDAGAYGMWRKNRRPNDDGSYGVDLNRNYPYEWGYDGVGSSPEPDNEVYRGPAPGSEPEVQAVMNLCTARPPSCAMNYHSSGNYLLTPWCYDLLYTPDSLLYRDLLDELTDFYGYQAGTSWEVLYVTNGDHDDWMYGEQSAKPRAIAMTTEIGEEFWQPDSAIIVAQTRENLPIALEYARIAGAFLTLTDCAVAGGALTPGAESDLLVTLRNVNWGTEPAPRAAVVLRSDCGDIELVTARTDLGLVDPRASASGGSPPLRVRCRPGTPAGHVVRFFVDLLIDGEYQSSDTVDLRVGTPYPVFADDFEGGTAYWNCGGSWGATTRRAHSPTQSAADSPYTNYAGDWDRSMVLGTPLDLSGLRSATLSFWHRRDLEGGWDFVSVEARTDTAAAWTVLESWTGHDTVWTRSAIDLGPFIGARAFQLRFRITTDQNRNYDGWYVDDVLVAADTGTNRPPPAPVLRAPADRASLAGSPRLVIDNARDPEGDPVHYEFVVYADSLLTEVAARTELAPGPDSTWWDVTPPLAPGRYFWRALAADAQLRGDYAAVRSFTIQGAAIAGPEPTPAASLTVSAVRERGVVRFTAGATATPGIRVYDGLGRAVARVALVRTAAGWQGTWATRTVPSGVYFYRAEAAGAPARRGKLVLVH